MAWPTESGSIVTPLRPERRGRRRRARSRLLGPPPGLDGRVRSPGSSPRPAAARADALRAKIAGTESPSLRVVGALAGVVPLLASGACGRGTARLRTDGESGVAFRAPGSDVYGPAAAVAADGTYLLEDGEDRDKYLRVAVHTDYLPEAAAEALVLLEDRYANHVGRDDVSAAEAEAGHVESWTVTLENVSASILTRVVAWIVETQDLQISDDGATWVRPTDEAHGLVLGSIAPGQTDVLHLRRSTPAGAPSSPNLLNRVAVAFDGL